MKVVGYVISYNSSGPDRMIDNKIQKEKIQAFCDKNRLELVNIYKDTVQRDLEPRHALVELMNIAPEKGFSGLLVYNYEKLSPDENLRNWIIQELKSHGVEVFSLTEAPMLSESQKAEKKSKTLKDKLRDLPSLPEVVVKISEIVQDPKSSAAQLAKVISHDSGLTSRVLRLVNSAYYGFPGQISGIQHAVTIVGFSTIRSLVLSSSIFRIFANKSGSTSAKDYKNFWRHSLLTAIASRIIFDKLFFEVDENIFSAAILHDIGQIILDQYDHDNYALAHSEAPNPLFDEDVLKAELKYCDVTHTYIGEYVAKSWNLPEPLTSVIRFHHSPLECEEHQKLTVVVYLANILSHLVLEYDEFSINYFSDDVLTEIGVTEEELIEIYDELTNESEQMKDIESFFK